jgi:trehalose 6-phosphate phosphatase
MRQALSLHLMHTGNTMAQPLPLWPHLPVILQRFIASEWCALLLDYDGTLTPLVTDPRTAHLSAAMQQILTALVDHPRYQVGIVSGRALEDLQGRVGGLALYMAGNHGLEMVLSQSCFFESSGVCKSLNS